MSVIIITQILIFSILREKGVAYRIFRCTPKNYTPGKFFHDLRYITEYPGVKENGYWIILINNYYGQRMVIALCFFSITDRNIGPVSLQITPVTSNMT